MFNDEILVIRLLLLKHN